MSKFTLDEISKHNKPNDMWVILKDCIYDISNFKHPGGDIIKGVAGQDATSIFITTHQNDLKIFDNIKKGLFKDIKFVGKIHRKDVNTNIFDKNYYKLKKNIYNIVDKNKNTNINDKDYIIFKALTKIILFIMSYIFLLSNTNLITSIIHGIISWLCLSDLFHEANHGSLITNNILRKICDFIPTSINQNQENWFQHHNLEHHIYTNLDKDNDIEDRYSFLRFNNIKDIKYKYQYIYTTVLYLLYIPYSNFKCLKLNFKHKNYHKILTSLLYYGIPILLGKIKYLFTSQLILSLITTIIFQSSHVNTKATFITNKDDNNFLKNQLNNTVNYSSGSKIINFLTGGLNHQIEHHLFPQINHIYYPQIQKYVKKFCNKLNLPYHDHTNIFYAYYDHLKHMYDVGNNV